MVLRFLCPNGHKIHCPDTQAGRAAKCPHCSVRFRVPALGQSGGQAEALPSDAPAEAAAQRKPVRSTKEPQIEFLCPNGHRLHGPSSLQGKPGQCPDCGSRFRIPIYDDVSDDEELEQDLGRGRADGADSTLNLDDPLAGGSGIREHFESFTEDEAQEESVDQANDELDEAPVDEESAEDASESDAAEEDESVEEDAADEEPAEAGDAENLQIDLGDLTTFGDQAEPPAWAELFARLWRYRGSGVALEVVFDDGRTLLPERFATTGPHQTHVVFAGVDHGANVVTVVPWSAVRRVVLRGLPEVPDELFG